MTPLNKGPFHCKVHLIMPFPKDCAIKIKRDPTMLYAIDSALPKILFFCKHCTMKNDAYGSFHCKIYLHILEI